MIKYYKKFDVEIRHCDSREEQGQKLRMLSKTYSITQIKRGVEPYLIPKNDHKLCYRIKLKSKVENKSFIHHVIS